MLVKFCTNEYFEFIASTFVQISIFFFLNKKSYQVKLLPRNSVFAVVTWAKINGTAKHTHNNYTKQSNNKNNFTET